MFVKPANLARRWAFRRRTICAELEAALQTGGGVRPQDHRGARHRRPRVRMRGAGQRRSGGVHALRDPAFARILRLRRQIRAEPGADRSAGRLAARARSPKCGGSRSSAIKPWDAKAWAASISCAKPRPANSTSTRSTRFPASRRSACIPKMWEYTGIPYAELIDRLIELALERHAAKKATRFTR